MANATVDHTYFKHTLNWIEANLKTGQSFNFPDYVMNSLILNAAIFDENEFICLVYNEYSRFSSFTPVPILFSQVMRVVSESSVEGSYIDAMTMIVNKYTRYYEKNYKEVHGVFNHPGAADAVLVSYLKDGRPNDAANVINI